MSVEHGDGGACPFLVTGATGFVGRHLLGELAASFPAREILALVRDPASWQSYDWTAALPDVRLVEGSVMGAPAWSRALPPLGGIFHLAAVVHHSRRGTEGLFETNVEGTLQMVRLAAEHRCRLVVLSTSGTVGCFDTPERRADEDAPFVEETVGGWPYYRSKIELERRAGALADELGVELVLIRPPILLGPGDHRLRSTRNVWKAIHRKLPFVIRGGIAFADVRDAAFAIARAMEHPEPHPVYHLEGTECGIREFFALVEEVSGVPAPPFLLPYRPAWWLARATERLGILPDPVVVEMASHYWGVTSLHAAADLGYKSRDPRETLRDTVEWLRESM